MSSGDVIVHVVQFWWGRRSIESWLMPTTTMKGIVTGKIYDTIAWMISQICWYLLIWKKRTRLVSLGPFTTIMSPKSKDLMSHGVWPVLIDWCSDKDSRNWTVDSNNEYCPSGRCIEQMTSSKSWHASGCSYYTCVVSPVTSPSIVSMMLQSGESNILYHFKRQNANC